LTGASGFIGSALLPRLEREGHEVWQLLRYVSGGRYSYWERQHKVFADLRDHDAVRKAVQDIVPDAIIHLGAITPVSFSFMSAVDVFEVNALGTINLANVAMDEGVEHFIHASTSEVYGIQRKFPIREDANLNPTSPYAVAKIAAEHHLGLLREIHSFPVTIIRPFNSYNRANVRNRHYAVERAITMALERHHIRLHNPRPVRDFLYRDDHVEAYVRCLTCVASRTDGRSARPSTCARVGGSPSRRWRGSWRGWSRSARAKRWRSPGRRSPTGPWTSPCSWGPGSGPDACSGGGRAARSRRVCAWRSRSGGGY